MVLYSDLYGSRHMLSRTRYRTPGLVTITAPANAAYIRVSAVGAGGWDNNGGSGGGGNWGHGAAFARKLATCSPGDQFTVQVGDTAHSQNSGDSAGDSIVTKVVGGTVICKAQRGGISSPGLAGSSVGDTTRSGSSATIGQGGAAAGDAGDTFELGFGGPGATQNTAAVRGGGGINHMQVYRSADATYILYLSFPPGAGQVVVEFFDQNPTIQWPGYGG